MRAVVAAHIVREEPEHSFVRIEVGDGGADLYLDDDDMMANHISGTEPWDLLVDGAKAAGWVILPAGCSTCVTDDGQRKHLPEGLDLDVRVVTSGADLIDVIRSA